MIELSHVDAPILQKAFTKGWPVRRRELVLMRNRRRVLLGKLVTFGFTVEEITGINSDSLWRFAAYPWWSSREKLTEDEHRYNSRVKLKKSRMLSPWDSAKKWNQEYTEVLLNLVGIVESYEHEPELFWQIWDWPGSIPAFHRNLKKLKKLWRKRDKRCEPPNMLLARLPEAWINGTGIRY